jgi:PTS system nitrogen regulatory IIA component
MIGADLILPKIAASSKKHALQLIAERVVAEKGGDEEALLAALIDRERIGSTGIGNGVAIPHIKMPELQEMYGVLATLQSSVDYDAVDDQPVDIVFMLLAPMENKTTQHLKMLAYISRFLKDENNRRNLRAVDTSLEIETLINGWAKTQAP